MLRSPSTQERTLQQYSFDFSIIPGSEKCYLGITASCLRKNTEQARRCILLSQLELLFQACWGYWQAVVHKIQTASYSPSTLYSWSKLKNVSYLAETFVRSLPDVLENLLCWDWYSAMPKSKRNKMGKHYSFFFFSFLLSVVGVARLIWQTHHSLSILTRQVPETAKDDKRVRELRADKSCCIMEQDASGCLQSTRTHVI